MTEESPTSQALVRVRKPSFRRGLTWVAVKHIRISAADYHEPGDELPGTYKRHLLQHLWRRNCIGPKGHPWTEWVTAAHRQSQARREKTAQAPNPVPEPKHASAVSVEAVGGGWYCARRDGKEIAKKRGLDAMNEWLVESGYAAVEM